LEDEFVGGGSSAPLTAFLLQARPTGTHRLEKRIARARTQLAEAGVALWLEAAAADHAYLEHRLGWEDELRVPAAFLGHDWDQVTSDRDAEQRVAVPPAPSRLVLRW
jgi:hypothetical protein